MPIDYLPVVLMVGAADNNNLLREIPVASTLMVSIWFQQAHFPK